MAEPIASRPYMPGYGTLDAHQGTGLLPWSWDPFSSSRGSRKARNLATNPACAITTDNPREPVIIEGTAELVQAPTAIAAFTAETNRKYQTDYSVDFFDPSANGCFMVRPRWAFGLAESDFTGSPTRWVFPSSSD